MKDAEVAIVGAGIAGAALAYALASRTTVLLLEREAQPGMHSTGRSAAMFMESYGPPQARALTRASRQFYAAPPDADFRAWPVTAGIDETWYFKPDAGQLLASPANADPVPPHDVMPEELDVAIGIAALEERTHLRIRRPRRTWAGLRSFLPDGELAIGFDANGLFWLAGQGGYGIQSAQGAAMLAAGLLGGGVVPAGLIEAGVEVRRMAPGRG